MPPVQQFTCRKCGRTSSKYTGDTAFVRELLKGAYWKPSGKSWLCPFCAVGK